MGCKINLVGWYEVAGWERVVYKGVGGRVANGGGVTHGAYDEGK